MTTPPIKTTLRDGTNVILRPITADDEHLIEIGLMHLSKESRYFRFMHPVDELSEEDLHRFADIDHINHIAWGAMDISGGKELPAGLARCIRASQESTSAEVAVAVIDRHQGKGLGTILLAAVAHDGVRKGISEFTATVLPGNRKMLDLFSELAAKSRRNDGIVNVTIPLHSHPEKYPDTPTGNAFKDVYRLIDETRASSASQGKRPS